MIRSEIPDDAEFIVIASVGITGAGKSTWSNAFVNIGMNTNDVYPFEVGHTTET